MRVSPQIILVCYLTRYYDDGNKTFLNDAHYAQIYVQEQ